ncbi:hypothetical protein GYH30_044336, partial [Glycine max]
RNKSLERLPMVLGMLPKRLLVDKSRVLRLDKEPI